MRGRKPKPLEIKIASEQRKCRINFDQPKPDKGIPEPPENLGKYGLEKYYELSELLNQMGVLAFADGSALAVCCKHYELMRTAEESLAKDGLLVYCSDHSIRANPAQRMHLQHAKEYARMLTEFGLTPTSRNRVSAKEKESTDPLAEYQRKRG